MSGGVSITDTSLRDGSHAVAHQFTERQVRDIVRALDAAGVPIVEVSHGDGLGGSSFNYGFSRVPELELIAAAVEESRHAKIAVLLLPGLGTTDDLRAAFDAGAKVVRVATHCTEADVSIQHFAFARELGLETVGFLMLSHMASPATLATQARIMVNAGCQCVYVVDSAGALILEEAGDRVEALVHELGDEASVGYHGHNNLGMGVANSIIAYQRGAQRIDGATRALGAGAGNAATEVLVAVFDRLGVETGIDLPMILEAAEEVVLPIMGEDRVVDRASIAMGYAGTYSSFLLHARRAAARYGVSAHDLLIEAGRRKYVGGQEDMLIAIAVEMAES